VKLFVEGGGNSNALRSACREGFTKFITAAGIRKRPRIVACGSRNDAFDSFSTAVRNGEEAMLLVDSEAAVSAACQQGEPENWTPWVHLQQRRGDEWIKPDEASDSQCHLMVECMESWFMADRATLTQFFAQGFKEVALPAQNRAIETVRKADIYAALKRATSASKKGEYGKGDHSFKLLAEINPAKVTGASPWAKRFIDELQKVMDS
jgi:hypothetical protein